MNHFRSGSPSTAVIELTPTPPLPLLDNLEPVAQASEAGELPEVPIEQLSLVDALDRAKELAPDVVVPLIEEGQVYCPECYLPLHPDPKPEKLYIFLHALRYTTSLGSFETEMPEWSQPGWTWDRS